MHLQVVHCTGCMKMSVKVSESGEEEKVPLFMVAIGVPLMFTSTFEVPLDRATFTSRHSLDMKFLSCDDRWVYVINLMHTIVTLLLQFFNFCPLPKLVLFTNSFFAEET